MPATLATREAAAQAVTALGSWISVHTGDPGTTGASEATGGSPAYARLQSTWSAGSADGVVDGSQVSINGAAGTYTHYGIWSAATGGTFVAGGPLRNAGDTADQAVTLGAQGKIDVTPKVRVS